MTIYARRAMGFLMMTMDIAGDVPVCRYRFPVCWYGKTVKRKITTFIDLQCRNVAFRVYMVRDKAHVPPVEFSKFG